MKNVVLALACFLSLGALSQIQRPMASPQGKVEQKVGLTDLKVEYYRPSRNNRKVFGDVVLFNELWRTGANENTKFTCSDPVLIGKDTLPTGTYAIFTKPTPTSWEIIFYKDINNWGTPDEWDEAKVQLRCTAPVLSMKDTMETFTIAFDGLTTKSALLSMKWETTRVEIAVQVPTAEKMQANIDKAMAGPTASDYFASAEFYFKEKKDMNKALEWINKAVESRPEAYWMLRLKAQIQAELGDFKSAIATAKLSSEVAEKAGNPSYVDMNKASIEAWSKKGK